MSEQASTDTNGPNSYTGLDGSLIIFDGGAAWLKTKNPVEVRQ